MVTRTTFDFSLPVIFLFVTYLCASIPFGVIIGKLFKGIDIRKTGSGNIGTSNAFRALGPVGGGAVFLLDALKGFVPVFIGAGLMHKYNYPQAFVSVFVIIAGITAILGHNYSIFLKFSGGKGVATSFGVFLGINWYIALICLAIWGLTVLISKISSLASIIAALSLPVMMLVFKQPPSYIIFAFLACGLAVYAHRSNIKRLLNGTELKMSTKEKKNVTEEESSTDL